MMGLFDRFKQGLVKSQNRLVHEIKRIVTQSPRLTADDLEEMEAALVAADLGMATTRQIVDAVKRAYETQGGVPLDVFAIAAREVACGMAHEQSDLRRVDAGLTVVSVVGVNGTGKTTTVAKLGHSLRNRQESVVLAACDTFRAAAIEQLKLWGDRLDIPVIAGGYGSDPAAVAHDAVIAAVARGAGYLLVDTAGRLHTKQNLMQELQKLHRVIGKQQAGAPHEILLVLDGSTGLNAVQQARAFNKSVPLTGLVVTKLDGTSKGGAVIAIQKELGLPVKFVGLGEQPDDLLAFDPERFARALFGEGTER
jgi:fused signal recognition particle receptor